MSAGTISKSLLIAMLVGCVAMTGCSRGIKEGIYALKGASGKIVVIQGDVSQLAKQYGAYRVEAFQNDVGEVCPPEFLAALAPAIEKELRYKSRSMKDRIKGKKKEEIGPFFVGPADKTLVIRGTVIQYEMGSMVDKAASPMDEAICRVKIYDSADELLLAEANCTGRSKSSVRTGPEELAKGVAKAIRKLLKPSKKKE